MTGLADDAARLRALNELDATLLVEAAAGTGKTALMAGRVTMLLASGAHPRSIAAITFTELAASALGARVHRYVHELLAGTVPKPLRIALPDGLTEAQRGALAAAASQLDELTATTIHAFCQVIICSYAVEADIDPGARILDATQAEAAFDAVFEQWFRRRLSGSQRADDPIAALSRYYPRDVADTLQSLARFRLQHRGARAPAADLGGRPDIDLVEAVADFRRWLSAQPAERRTLELVGHLEALANHFAGSFETPPGFDTLWRLAHPERLPCMRRHTFDLLTPKTKSAWDRAAGKDRGAALNEAAGQHFERVDHCYRVILGRIATALVEKLSDGLDEVLGEYAAFKRAAAVLDFDDLLERARALVREHDTVRRALGRRYQYIFVDEFQDTDPIQAEILFWIAAEDAAPRWQDSALREGGLFMVGDPKQSIYRFRGADVGSYADARDAILRRWPDNIVQITANFRSRPAILTHINGCFAAPLSGPDQPGYVALTPTLDPPGLDLPCVAKIAMELPPNARSSEIRDAEAEAVAEVCTRLIGNVDVRDDDGEHAPLTPGGIALLAPTGAELWRYERALEARGLPIASQAGKGLFRRQEVQDILALARVLADGGDTLAFGALMRGPLVGLTEEELLDITAALPPVPADRPEAMPRFSVRTPVDQVGHPIASEALSILQGLRRRARTTTPALLLAEAVERLSARPILSAREGDRSGRALANVEAVLEKARPYGVRGLKRFVRDFNRDWRLGTACSEGRVDAEGDAIEIITIHSAKGLEWPVVIPINAATMLRSRDRFVHRADDDTLHWVIGDVVPPDLLAALRADDESLRRERERLWYVACTRARELLIVPELPPAEQNSWARVVDLAHRALPELEVSHLAPAPATIVADSPNAQTAEVFASERAVVDETAVPLTWIRPSDHDRDRLPVAEVVALEAGEAPEVDGPVGAGRVRGLLLQKLMEEMLTGELSEDLADFVGRARMLLGELVLDPTDQGALPDPEEIARTGWRTLQLPEVAALRDRLIPEWPVYGLLAGRTEPSALAGRIDAIAFAGDAAEVVVDWKSDIDPTEADMRLHAVQLEDYLRATGAARGALVYMTPGTVRWVVPR
ncbi:UvrD-helicase domain-containing protein [Aminobacter sp. MDW-2]|uniref:UvrD-helicase domain-containing protein n=1 Tax=Aminobacter sp. MDW-2 TaxID=2666139 RepID=UPI0012AF8D2F|nr:UvrD-helicase domain-containing protein [Aminobacter sp. MDW-2]MRX36935.1 AAA family ATPase [Aminobacter sp. MDW-2]QNH37955.1 UvrD-helicase domain-containing protein [Aminobacter sp. MDW-2]